LDLRFIRLVFSCSCILLVLHEVLFMSRIAYYKYLLHYVLLQNPL